MKALREFIIRLFLKEKPKGVMTTIPNKELVDMNMAVIAEKLMRNGIDPRSLKNANQVENAIKMIDDRPKVQEGITSTKSAKIMDMEGKEIDPRSRIMGGKQAETEAEIAERLSRENKEGISRIRERQKMIDNAIDNQSPGFSGDRKVDAVSVAEEMAERMGKVYDDLPIKEQTKLYGEAFDALSKRKFDPPEDFAQGGRAGFKVGSPSKRKFLGIMGSIAATIAGIKSGLIGTGGKETAKQVVKESVKDVANAPPKYFFDLANKIKLLGKESKVKPQERVNEYNYVGKNGDEYTLTEDIGTGDMQITKDKAGVGIADEKTFDTINDRTVMEYKAPRKDADPDTQTILKEGAEYDEYKVEFDMDGTPADADDISEIIKKEIIEEAADIPIKQKIKRAGGGVAYMLGE